MADKLCLLPARRVFQGMSVLYKLLGFLQVPDCSQGIERSSLPDQAESIQLCRKVEETFIKLFLKYLAVFQRYCWDCSWC